MNGPSFDIRRMRLQACAMVGSSWKSWVLVLAVSAACGVVEPGSAAAASAGDWEGTVHLTDRVRQTGGIEESIAITMVQTAFKPAVVTGFGTRSEHFDDGFCQTDGSSQHTKLSASIDPIPLGHGRYRILADWQAVKGSGSYSLTCRSGYHSTQGWIGDSGVMEKRVSGDRRLLAGHLTYHSSSQGRVDDFSISYRWHWVPLCGRRAPLPGATPSTADQACPLVKAVARPIAAPRGSRASVDGSGSYSHAAGGEQRKVSDYRWTLTPAKSCAGGQRVSGKGETMRFTILCDTRASLTVTDDTGRKANTKTLVPVQRRVSKEWRRTEFSFAEDTSRRGPWGPPSIHGGIGGENVDAATGRGADAGVIAQVAASRQASYEGTGYTLAKVPQSENGPFAGLWFVNTTTLGLHRAAAYNPYIWADSPPPPGAAHNMAAEEALHSNEPGPKADLARYRRFVQQHEGMGGDLAPGGGHGSLQRNALDKTDPRRDIEPKIGADRRKLARDVDQTVIDDDHAIYQAAQHPPDIYSTYLWVWNAGEWLLIHSDNATSDNVP
jgi:hypothetical protein